MICGIYIRRNTTWLRKQTEATSAQIQCTSDLPLKLVKFGKLGSTCQMVYFLYNVLAYTTKTDSTEICHPVILNSAF